MRLAQPAHAYMQCAGCSGRAEGATSRVSLGTGMPMRRRGCVCGTTSVCSSFDGSGYSGYPLYWFSLATDCRWRRRQLDLQLVVSRICRSDGRALGMMERRLSSIDGANLTNLDTLRYDRPCLRSLVAASPRSVPAVLRRSLAHLSARLSIFASRPSCHTSTASWTCLL